jgi:hypothetical protein
MPSSYSRTRRRKQPTSPNQLELPFPEIQLELFKPETSKRFDHFEDFLLRMQRAQTKRNPTHLKG